jgi:putative acetyltransferase
MVTARCEGPETVRKRGVSSVPGVLIQSREITHPDVTALIRAAERELAERYPHEAPSPVDPLARFAIAYVRGEPVGCGAVVAVAPGVGEVKRMWVDPAHRRSGIARRILAALERTAERMDISVLILETGLRQPEAISLYEGHGYTRTEPYGEYIGNPTSVCYEKKIQS